MACLAKEKFSALFSMPILGSPSDDAAAIEMMGYAPKLVSGSPLNLKITVPGDLEFAEMVWLNQRNQKDNE